MRHGKKVDMLSKPADQRKALRRSLTTEVIKHGQILTTETRAKVVQKDVEKMVGLAKRGDLHARRQAAAFLYGDRRGKVTTFDEKEKFDTQVYSEIIKEGFLTITNQVLENLEKEELGKEIKNSLEPLLNSKFTKTKFEKKLSRLNLSDEQKELVMKHAKKDQAEKKDKKVHVYEKTPVQHLFSDIAPKYKDRNGGYVRVIKAPPRRGDAAPMAIVQLV